MKNESLYNKTVDILVQAYFNDTLVHGHCAACAVGNLIAANCGYQIDIGDEDNIIWINNRRKVVEPDWTKVFCTNRKSSFLGLLHRYEQTINFDKIDGCSLYQINSTGYAPSQLARIEFAFESVSKNKDYTFNGLMAVIDVLDEIHENKDSDITIQNKNKFHKKELQKVI